MSVGRASRHIMRAVRVAAFGGPENLKLETSVPVPVPGENEVLYTHCCDKICRCYPDKETVTNVSELSI